MDTHRHSTEIILGDYCDGKRYREHPLFSNDPVALQLILYYDELELCNPLGSRRKKHKIGKYAHIDELKYITYYMPYHVLRLHDCLLSTSVRCLLFPPWKFKSSVKVKNKQYSTSTFSEV